MSRCLTPAELRGLLAAEVSDDVQAAAEQHLEVCPDCREALEALADPAARLETWWARAAGQPPDSSPALDRAVQQLTGSLEEPPEDPAADALAAILARLEPATRAGAMGRLGAYEVIELVEAGGMGIVLRAFDSSLERVVALKVLYPLLAAHPAARQRFLREARLAASIRHDHVVTIYAVADANGLPFFAMEFIEGESLARRLERDGPLAVPALVRVGREIAAGLAAAHDRGIVHRDIKPANVLLETATGRAKLTDFGLARAVDDAGLTRIGYVPGTPEYLSPEQARGEPSDVRSDLFSLGCVLYAAAAGRSPFHAGTALAALRRVAELNPRPLHRVNPAVPRWLSELVRRLLSKAPAQRPPSAKAVLEQLEAQRPATAHRAGWILAAVLVGLLALWRPAGLRRAGPSAVPASNRVVRATTPERSPFVVLAADGSRSSGHESLAEAVAAVPLGGVLRLCWDGPRVIPPIVLPPRPLTVRRAAEFNPLWVVNQTNGPAILATAPLVLAGPEFEFQMPAEVGRSLPRTTGADGRAVFPADTIPSGLAFVHAKGARLRIEGCSFRADFDRAPGSAGFACLVLEDVPTCEIEESLLDVRRGAGIVWRFEGATGDATNPLATLELRRAAIQATDAVWFTAAGDRSARLSVHHVTFAGRSVLFLAPGLRRAARLEVEVPGCVLNTDWLLIDRRDDVSEPLPRWMRWSGHPALSHPRLGFIPNREPGTGPFVATQEGWDRFWTAAPSE